MADSGGFPKFVVTEFEEYLNCGILEKGCMHLECRSCGFSQLVAFSCKRRAQVVRRGLTDIGGSGFRAVRNA
jgi:hypothetical protein